MTTVRTGAPSGFIYTGVYHAAGHPHGKPPYLRRMTAYPPRGERYDTSVPQKCSASDLQLALAGPAACPAGSRIGGGTTVTAFAGMFTSRLKLEVFNNTDEQIMLARSPLLTTVSRGRIHADGSIEFASPTCFPSTPLFTRCPADDVLQLRSAVVLPAYVRYRGGVRRSYLTTPPDCPRSGYWRTPVRFWWADGSIDTVITKQPCVSNQAPGPRPARCVGSGGHSGGATGAVVRQNQCGNAQAGVAQTSGP